MTPASPAHTSVCDALGCAVSCPIAAIVDAAKRFERAVKAYSAWNTRPADEYERQKYDAMKGLFAALEAVR